MKHLIYIDWLNIQDEKQKNKKKRRNDWYIHQITIIQIVRIAYIILTDLWSI